MRRRNNPRPFDPPVASCIITYTRCWRLLDHPDLVAFNFVRTRLLQYQTYLGPTAGRRATQRDGSSGSCVPLSQQRHAKRAHPRHPAGSVTLAVRRAWLRACERCDRFIQLLKKIAG